MLGWACLGYLPSIGVSKVEFKVQEKNGYEQHFIGANMESRYALIDPSQLLSPSIVIFRSLIEANLQSMVSMAGTVDRLRPHCKTHKMPAITALEVERGILKHKAATLAEAEMLADVGVDDIVLAYNPVGPNVDRVVAFRRRFPSVRFGVTADHPVPLGHLGRAMAAAGTTIDVLLDLNVGLHRTGVSVEQDPDRAASLYRTIAETEGVSPSGFHVYDGNNHQRDRAGRRAAVEAGLGPVLRLRDDLRAAGFNVPRIVAGGTGTFPIYAAMDDPTIEVCPGTCVLHDAGYGDLFQDLKFVPAALLFTRVVSLPVPGRLTLDLGYKAVASDPALGQRILFPDLPDAALVLQNEEHLVLETSRADRFVPGDAILGIPWHICPSMALHRQVYVVEEGRAVGTWDVVGRDRVLSM